MAELDNLQKRTLELFAKSPLRKQFYWTGGTLLSHLYLHHRRSEDLDFFSDNNFSYEQVMPFVQGLEKKLDLKKITERKIFDRREFILQNECNLKLEFVLYNFPKLKPRKKWQGIMVDSLDDIAVNKTMALFERAQPKDLIDLYFLLTKKNYKLKTLLSQVEKKFGAAILEDSILSQCLLALKNINDVTPLLLVEKQQGKKKLIDNIKNYFENISSNYLKRTVR